MLNACELPTCMHARARSFAYEYVRALRCLHQAEREIDCHLLPGRRRVNIELPHVAEIS